MQATSLENVRTTAGGDISAMRLRELYDRVEACQQQYFSLSKSFRIEHGLREDVGFYGYSGARLIQMSLNLITQAFRGSYPFKSHDQDTFFDFKKERLYYSAQEVIKFLEPKINDLEIKLRKAIGLSTQHGIQPHPSNLHGN